MEAAETFGERLRWWGKARYGQQRLLAEALEIDPSRLSVYVNDQTLPSAEVLMRLAKLGLNLNWLATGVGNPDILNFGVETQSATRERAFERVEASLHAALVALEEARRLV